MWLESHISAQNTGVNWTTVQVSTSFSKTGFRSSAANGNNFAKIRRLTKHQFSLSKLWVHYKTSRLAKNPKMISWKKTFLVNRMQLWPHKTPNNKWKESLKPGSRLVNHPRTEKVNCWSNKIPTTSKHTRWSRTSKSIKNFENMRPSIIASAKRQTWQHRA